MKFGKLFGGGPEVQKAIDAETQRIRQAGKDITTQIKNDTEAVKAAITGAHAPEMARLEAKAAETKQNMLDVQKQARLNLACSSLESGIYGPLMTVRARAGGADAVKRVREEVEKRTAGIKANPSAQTVSDFRQWVLSEVGGDEKNVEKVQTAFQNFTKELEQIGIAL